MYDVSGMIAALKRPPLLVQAARFGVDEYDRSLHLGRLLGDVHLPRPGEALVRLLDREATMNAERIQKHATYSIARHVELLIGIMGEARLYRAALRPVAVS